MPLSDAIYTRKAVRAFEYAPPDGDVLDGIRKFIIEEAKPLLPRIRFAYSITDRIASASVKSPLHIAIYSEKAPGYLTNAGFIFEQVCLYMHQAGLGCCWVGMGKPDQKAVDGEEFVILIAFGTPKVPELAKRDVSEFNRKPLAMISDTADKRFEPARLAPSAMNSQPWYFAARAGEPDCFDVYCKKAAFPMSVMVGSTNRIDIGIALSHLYAQYPESFAFELPPEGAASPEKKGFIYIGKVKI